MSDKLTIIMTVLAATVLIGCGSSTTPAYTIGGSISGLTSGAVTLQNNGGDLLVVNANGNFTFSSKISQNGTYAVSIASQPSNSNCVVTNSSGVVTNSVTNVTVSCLRTGKFAYVGTDVGFIEQYNIDTTTGALTAMTQPTVSSGVFPWSITVEPGGKYVYAVSSNGPLLNGIILQYNINNTTGELTAMTPASLPTELDPVSLAIDPGGKFVYVVNKDSNTVSQYSIASTTGALTAIGTIPTASIPSSIAVDPSGRFVYVVNNGSNTVSQYSINTTTGALTIIGTAPTDSGPNSVTVHPNGKYVYVANGGANVSQYTVNQTTGALTAMSPATVNAGNSTYAIAVDPTGRFAYAANFGDGTVSQYTIDSVTGALTAMTPSTVTPASVASPSHIFSVAVDPSGKYAYATTYSGRTVSMFSINSNTGALMAITPPAVTTGSNALSVVTTAGPR